jgi:hypothetical protein
VLVTAVVSSVAVQISAGARKLQAVHQLGRNRLFTASDTASPRLDQSAPPVLCHTVVTIINTTTRARRGAHLPTSAGCGGTQVQRRHKCHCTSAAATSENVACTEQ